MPTTTACSVIAGWSRNCCSNSWPIPGPATWISARIGTRYYTRRGQRGERKGPGMTGSVRTCWDWHHACQPASGVEGRRPLSRRGLAADVGVLVSRVIRLCLASDRGGGYFSIAEMDAMSVRGTWYSGSAAVTHSPPTNRNPRPDNQLPAAPSRGYNHFAAPDAWLGS